MNVHDGTTQMRALVELKRVTEMVNIPVKIMETMPGVNVHYMLLILYMSRCILGTLLGNSAY